MRGKTQTVEYNPDEEPIVLDVRGEAAKYFLDMEQGEQRPLKIMITKKAYSSDMGQDGKPHYRCELLVTKIDGEKLDQSEELDKHLRKQHRSMMEKEGMKEGEM